MVSNKNSKYRISYINFKYSIIKERINNFNILHFANKDCKNIVIYVHGGKYVKEASYSHYKFVE